MRGYYKKVSRVATACDLFCECVRHKVKTRRQLKKISQKSVRRIINREGD